MHTYSTTPQKIGTWHNGKDIYEVVVPNLNITLTNSWQNLVDLRSENIDEVIYVDALGTYYNSKASMVAVNAGQIAFVDGYIQGYKIRDNAVVKTVIVQYTKNASS